MSQFQQNRSAAAGAGQYGVYGGGYAAQQQPVMDWGQGFHSAQQQALANMTGYGGMDPTAAAAGDGDADGGFTKRQRMEEQAMMAAAGMAGAPHTSSSTNQLQALGNPNAGWHQAGGGNQMVEGNDLTQVYEQARAQQAYQQQAYQQQQHQQQQQSMYAGYGAGLMDNYAEAPINNLHPSDLQQQMMMQQQQQHLQPGAYHLNQGAGRTRIDPARPAGYSSRVPVPVAQSQPSRLTTGHKHAEYLQNLVRARFNSGGAAGGAAGGMVTRSATNSYPTHPQHGMQYPGYYQPYGMPGHDDGRGEEEEADQVLSKCEAVSLAPWMRDVIVWQT
jgi:hypothetical protein